MERVAQGHLRLQNALVVLIMGLYLAVAWQAREPLDLQGADELEYIALSKSIEQGSYREIFQPGAPWAAKYPPAYPAFITVVRQVAGENTDWIRFANIVLVGAALVMCFVCTRKFAGGWLALGVLVVSAANPQTLMNAGSLMSEAPYFFLTTTALFAMFQADQSRRWATAAVIVFVLLAFLARTAGITIVVAAAIWFAMRRPRRDLIVFAAAAAVVVGGWFAYLAAVTKDSAGNYARDLADAGVQINPSSTTTPTTKTNPESTAAPATQNIPDAREPGRVMRMAKIAANSAYKLARGSVISALAVPTVEGTIADNILWSVAIVVLAVVGMIALWTSWRPMPIYMVLYGGLLLAWPYLSHRLVSVIVPFLTLAMFLGARTILNRFNPRVALAGVVALGALLLIGAVQGDIVRSRAGAACDRANLLGLNGCNNALEQSMIHASAYLRAHSNPQDVVASSKAPSINYLTNRLTVPARHLMDLSSMEIIDTLRARGIRYLVVGLYLPVEDGRVAARLQRRCSELRVEWNGMPHAMLLSVLPPGETASDACALLPEIKKGFAARD